MKLEVMLGRAVNAKHAWPTTSASHNEWVAPSGPFLGFVSQGIVVIVVVVVIVIAVSGLHAVWTVL